VNLGLSHISVSELTRRVIERTGFGNWFLLVTEKDAALGLAEQIAYGLSRTAGEGEAVVVDRPGSVEAVVALARRKSTLVLAGLDEWPVTEWARWDVVRSRLLPSHRVVLVVPKTAADRLFNAAPHFIRLFSGSMWEAKAETSAPSEEDRAGLLAALESWGKMSTAEMVRRAEAKQLPSDPEYVDWLVLAGRSDLL
jgi:hypothetical protein